MLESLLSNILYNHSAGVKVICDTEYILTLKTGRQCKLAHGLITYAGWSDGVFV